MHSTRVSVSVMPMYFSDNCGKLEASYVVGVCLVVSPPADPNDLTHGGVEGHLPVLFLFL